MDMEAMVNTVKGWIENPIKFARSHGVQVTPAMKWTTPESQVHVLILEGFCFTTTSERHLTSGGLNRTNGKD